VASASDVQKFAAASSVVGSLSSRSFRQEVCINTSNATEGTNNIFRISFVFVMANSFRNPVELRGNKILQWDTYYWHRPLFQDQAPCKK
jgi:hypothetical protein